MAAEAVLLVPLGAADIGLRAALVGVVVVVVVVEAVAKTHELNISGRGHDAGKKVVEEALLAMEVVAARRLMSFLQVRYEVGYVVPPELRGSCR